jgi:hypothetical protein
MKKSYKGKVKPRMLLNSHHVFTVGSISLCHNLAWIRCTYCLCNGIKIISAWHKQFEDINDQDYRICFYSKTLIFFLSFILRPLINT